jgi:alanine racemase
MKTWIEIDTLALMRNVRVLREAIGEGVKLFAVVKANAYGHGFELCTEAFWRGGVDGFMVTDTADALFLVQKGYKVPTFLLNPPQASELGELIHHRVRLPGVNKSFLETVKTAALRQRERAIVHLELETGMHRFGVSLPEAKVLLAQVRDPQSPYTIEGVYSHLYDADNPETTRRQIEEVSNFLFSLQTEGEPVPFTHLVASDSLFGTPHDYWDGLFEGVRFGRLLYGADRAQCKTEPTLTWKTNVITINRLRRSETLGYGGAYKAEKDTLVGILPIGYSDGIDRGLSNKGWVLVQGRKCPIIGRVCMNNMFIDLSAVLRPELGDEVVLLGSQGKESVSPGDWAQILNTIDDEVISRIPANIPRLKKK